MQTKSRGRKEASASCGVARVVSRRDACAFPNDTVRKRTGGVRSRTTRDVTTTSFDRKDAMELR